MYGHSLRNIYVTRGELIEELRNQESALPDCIIQSKGSNAYIFADWVPVCSMDNTRTICACYEGVSAKIPFNPGVSPYTLGCIVCDDPDQYEGYLAESHISWCGDRGLPEDLRPEVERAFLELKKRLRKRCKPWTWHTTEGDKIFKVFVSPGAITALKSGKKLCQNCGPDYIDPGVFYIESDSERIVIY